jgi:hypothetical protein
MRRGRVPVLVWERVLGATSVILTLASRGVNDM